MEIRELSAEYICGLIKLWEDNVEEFKYFAPHAFTREALESILSTVKLDLYYVIVSDGVIGYGLLRGLDEGYSNFSLGIAIDKEYYGTGLAKMFMNFLELQSILRGHSNIRLSVNADNKRAFTLYQKLGYVYGPSADGYVVGIKEL